MEGIKKRMNALKEAKELAEERAEDAEHELKALKTEKEAVSKYMHIYCRLLMLLQIDMIRV